MVADKSLMSTWRTSTDQDFPFCKPRHNCEACATTSGSSVCHVTGMPPAVSLPAFDFREGCDTEAISRVENIPVVHIFEGYKLGGAPTALATMKGPPLPESAPATTPAKRINPRLMSQNPELRKLFCDIVHESDSNQLETRALFRKLKRVERDVEKNIGGLSEKLRIMRSLPDISMDRQEFDLFVGNAMEQQQQLNSQMASELETFMDGHKMASVRHIFPLRNPETGKIRADNQVSKRWRH